MARKVKDPGFGESTTRSARRIVNKDGSFNIKHVNGKVGIASLYSYLVAISWPRFFLLVFAGYSVLNFIFAGIYVAVGIEGITTPKESFIENFINAFFFSAQTVTTLGYGAMSPTSIASGIVSSIQALIGLLSFSFVTGLLYGRFSKPRASIKFSENIIYREFNEGHALMFRLMNRRTNIMINPKIVVTLSIGEHNENNEYKRNFYQLALERDQVTYLPTTWTVVHEIAPESPLYKYKKEDLQTLNGEFLIMITYYDEAFNDEVHQIHSYTFQELLLDVKFQKAFHFDEDGYTVLDHQKISNTEHM